MPLALLAALCALPGPITLQARAQPLSQLLPKLSEKVGRTLAVHPSLAREQIVIDVKDVAPDALLERIAEVTHAQWTEESGEYRLRRPAEKERALAAEERAFHAKTLRKQWAERVQSPFDAKKAAEALREMRRKQDQTETVNDAELPEDPGERYISELLLALPTDSIAGLRNRQGVVFSNRPSGSQRPLPSTLVPIVARLFRDQETFTNIVAPLFPEDYRDATPVKVTLSVEASRPKPGMLRLVSSLTLRDDATRPIASALDVTESFPDSPPRPSEPGEPLANLGPLAMEMETARSRQVSSGSANPSALSEALRRSLSNPERDGRLTQTWSDAMFALAAKEARSLVANLPDDAEGAMTPDPRGQLKLREYLDRLTGSEFQRSGEWMTVRPRFPGPAGVFRADRSVVGPAVRSIANGRALPMEEAAAVISRAGTETQVLWHRIQLLDPTGGASFNSLTADPFGYAILNGLSNEARRAVYSGRSLTFAQMPVTLQNELRDYYLNAGTYRFLIVPDRPDIPESDPTLDRDATEFVGPAQVTGATLTASVDESLAFIGRSSRNPERVVTLDPYALLPYLDEQMRVRKRPIEDGIEGIDEVRYTTDREVTLKIHFPNGFRHEITLTEKFFDMKAPYVKLADLKADVRAYLARKRKEVYGTPKDEGGKR